MLFENYIYLANKTTINKEELILAKEGFLIPIPRKMHYPWLVKIRYGTYFQQVPVA